MSRDIPRVKPSARQCLEARRLLRRARAATVATTMPETGAAYASLVTVATDQDGSPILLLSGLAEHTVNLTAEARCALLVEEAAGLPNPQTGPRATFMGRAEKIAPGAERDRLAGRFLARHPGAALYAGFGDFAIWRMTVERVHLVGGFARAVWLEDGIMLPVEQAADFAAAEPGVVAHMNEDHGEAVEAYARGFLGQPAGSWRLRAVDADGLDIGLEGDGRDGVAEGPVLRLDFDPPLESSAALRERLVALARTAREQT